MLLQERAEGGPSANVGGLPRVQEDQGQTAPPRGAHQQTGFVQVHLRKPTELPLALNAPSHTPPSPTQAGHMTITQPRCIHVVPFE